MAMAGGMTVSCRMVWGTCGHVQRTKIADESSPMPEKPLPPASMHRTMHLAWSVGARAKHELLRSRRSCFGSRCQRRRVEQRAFPQLGALVLQSIWGPILPYCVWCLSGPLVEVVGPSVSSAAWFWGRAASAPGSGQQVEYVDPRSLPCVVARPWQGDPASCFRALVLGMCCQQFRRVSGAVRVATCVARVAFEVFFAWF